MKIFIAGGTGAIGRPLIAELLAQGHSLVALTRSSEKAQALVEQGIEARVLTEIEQQVLQSPKLEGIVLRYGFFYGIGTWFHPDGDVARQVREQQFPIVGSGAGVWSWLHVEDAAIATARAGERGNPGIYLIANDQPLAVREWLPAFAKWLNAPPPPELSVEDAQKATGADAVYYGTQMRGASNAKAKRELNFQPRALEWNADMAMVRAS